MSKSPRPTVLKSGRKEQRFEGMDKVEDENEVNGAGCKATSEKKERSGGQKYGPGATIRWPSVHSLFRRMLGGEWRPNTMERKKGESDF